MTESEPPAGWTVQLTAAQIRDLPRSPTDKPPTFHDGPPPFVRFAGDAALTMRGPAAWL